MKSAIPVLGYGIGLAESYSKGMGMAIKWYWKVI